jgi:hypothetical protein
MRPEGWAMPVASGFALDGIHGRCPGKSVPNSKLSHYQ